jgi:3-oxoacyl-[acyl-carrier protein] reductase
MDLGLAGKKALVCAASKGLGRGCAEALAREGVDVTIVARTEATLRQAAEDIGATTGRAVGWVACDITTAEGRGKALAACPQPDILVNNAGGPPPGDFRDWDRDAWLRAIDANMLTPIELIKATVDGMIARKFGRIVNITSSAVKAPIDILGLSNGARSGLTGFVAGLARKVARHNVTINNLLPGCAPTWNCALRRRGSRWRSCARRKWTPIRPDDSARRPSSASPAHFCAAPTRATSSGRTC